MRLKEVKKVTLFKFVDEQSRQLNIYVEPTSDDQGRLILSTHRKIFQRFFDGAGKNGIYKFLTKQTPESISCCFDDISDEDQELLSKRLKEVWPIFIGQVEQLSDRDILYDS